MLEQTTHLPLAAMYEPAQSPLAVLERVTGRALVGARRWLRPVRQRAA